MLSFSSSMELSSFTKSGPLLPMTNEYTRGDFTFNTLLSH